MYKLIATDLDGTLLKKDKTISPRTFEVLQKLDSNGILFVPSTGRCHNELPEAVAGLPFLHYVLTYNGGGVYDYDQQHYLSEVTIEASVVERLVLRCRDFDLHPSIVVSGHRYIESAIKDQMPDGIAQASPPKIFANTEPCLDLIEKLRELNHDVQKMLLYFNDENTRNEVMVILRSEFDNLVFSSSSSNNIEINAKGADKGNGLKTLCCLLNIDITDTIAFGDAANDLAMLDAAGLACVMANGTEEAKKHAHCICLDNENDGVAVKLEELFKDLL